LKSKLKVGRTWGHQQRQSSSSGRDSEGPFCWVWRICAGMLVGWALESAKAVIQLLEKPSNSNFSPQTSDELISSTTKDRS